MMEVSTTPYRSRPNLHPPAPDCCFLTLIISSLDYCNGLSTHFSDSTTIHFAQSTSHLFKDYTDHAMVQIKAFKAACGKKQNSLATLSNPSKLHQGKNSLCLDSSPKAEKGSSTQQIFRKYMLSEYYQPHLTLQPYLSPEHSPLHHAPAVLVSVVPDRSSLSPCSNFSSYSIFPLSMFQLLLMAKKPCSPGW